MKWVAITLACILLPFAVYVLSKAATLGRLQATQQFRNKLFYTKQEEKRNGKE